MAKAKGMPFDEDEKIQDDQDVKFEILNENITKTREEWMANLAGMAQDLNAVIKNPANKISLN